MLEKIGRKSVMHPSNEFYDVARRSYIPEHSKAIALTDEQLSKIDDVRIVLALRMEAAFGLRMEEALKYRPSYSYSPGDAVIKLRPQSTKGGRPREIPVVSGAMSVGDATSRSMSSESRMSGHHVRQSAVPPRNIVGPAISSGTPPRSV